MVPPTLKAETEQPILQRTGSQISKSDQSPEWLAEFPIQSIVDLDFLIGQNSGWPVGMTRSSPPEFRRRVRAAVVSYLSGLSSIDYALKRYVKRDQYETYDTSLGDIWSDFLRDSTLASKEELRAHHTQEGLTFGQFGAEITLFKFPETLDLARMVSNRGLLLETLPILRLGLEMLAWSAVAFYTDEEEDVRRLKAQHCVSKLKSVYETAGILYGYLSTFSHWEHAIHSHFLNFSEERVSVITASRRHRAMALTLCLIVLDIFVEVIRNFYSTKGEALIVKIQRVPDRSDSRKVHQLLVEMDKFADPLLSEVRCLLR